MNEHYLFPQPGSIPGRAGLFSGVRVNVTADGTLDIQPLAQHSMYVPADDESSVHEAPSDEQEDMEVQ